MSGFQGNRGRRSLPKERFPLLLPRLLPLVSRTAGSDPREQHEGVRATCGVVGNTTACALRSEPTSVSAVFLSPPSGFCCQLGESSSLSSCLTVAQNLHLLFQIPLLNGVPGQLTGAGHTAAAWGSVPVWSLPRTLSVSRCTKHRSPPSLHPGNAQWKEGPAWTMSTRCRRAGWRGTRCVLWGKSCHSFRHL